MSGRGPSPVTPVARVTREKAAEVGLVEDEKTWNAGDRKDLSRNS